MVLERLDTTRNAVHNDYHIETLYEELLLFIVIFPFMLSQSKNDQKCIVYPSHADILLQHYIISSLCVL